jgi:thiamine-phosphate pyrophosphorylase
MITDPTFSIKEIKKAIIKHKPDFVCYRNKLYYNEDEIIEFANFTKKYSKAIINYDSLQNKKLLKFFDGIHFPSTKLDEIKNYNTFTIASTHNILEVKKAFLADFITFSPIFNSKGRIGVGVEKLNEIAKFHPNVLALGGIISKKEVEIIKNSKAKGFASIRYFFTD